MHEVKDSVFNSIVTYEVKKLRDIFKKHGYQIRIAGGAVRDALMGKQPKDLDFATTASVLQMKKMFAKEYIKTVNSFGEKFGTVTARIKGQDFEITTMTLGIPGRPTYGDWLRDARRRDFTMNSMFLDFDGNVLDLLGGYNDLKEGKVRFIGGVDSAVERQHLRILRYFRFHSQFAKDPAQHEDGVLQSIKRNAAGLLHVSGEKIWKELKLILQEKSRNVVIQIMMDVGIGTHIGIAKPNFAEFQNVALKYKDTDMQPASLLAALLNDTEEADRLHVKFKFSADERKLINYIIRNRQNTLITK